MGSSWTAGVSKLQFWYYDAVRASHPLPGYVLPLQGANGWQQARPKSTRSCASIRESGCSITVGAKSTPDNESRTTWPDVTTSRSTSQSSAIVSSTTPRRRPDRPEVSLIQTSCNGQLLLQDVTSRPGAVRAGEILPIALRWQALTKLNTDYVVSWRLLDSAGHTVLQRDFKPADGFVLSQTWQADQEVVDRDGMLISSFLPPGQYSAVVVVYNQANGAACQWKRGKTVLPSTELPLRSVDVADTMPLPPLGPAKPEHTLAVQVGSLSLIGYDSEDQTYRPGDVASLRLYWQVNAPVTANLSVQARLTTSQGTTLEAKQSVLGNAFPTSRWQAGRTVATYVDVPIPGNRGEWTASADPAIRGAGSAPVVVSNFPALKVVARPRTYTAPPIPVAGRRTSRIRLHSSATVCGRRPNGTIEPGQTDRSQPVLERRQGDDHELQGVHAPAGAGRPDFTDRRMQFL